MTDVVKWECTSHLNDGRTAFQHDICEDRPDEEWPGVLVGYGQTKDGAWRVSVAMALSDTEVGEVFGSDTIRCEEDAHQVALAVITGLRGMWP